MRYEPDDRCPPLTAALSALQIFVPNTVGLIMLAALIVGASHESSGYLAWVMFTALAVSGAGMILHSLRFRYLGSGHFIVANFNVPFLAICALALQAGGPGLLATLLVASTLFQFVLTLRLASLRRIFTPTVSGVVVMLVAVSAVPYIMRSTIVVPEGDSALLFIAPGIAALTVGAAISLQGAPVWRMWALPATVCVGLAVAAPLGLYDVGVVADARWLSLPDFGWPGLDLAFGADFWGLLPVFVFVNLTAFMKAVGDLSMIARASYRSPAALDYRKVQGGLTVYGVGALASGLLGTLPVAAPWAVTVVYVSFTGVAARRVGIYLGLLTIAAAPFSKLLALLVAVPSPVVSAVYVIVFGMLFVEGAKTVFSGPVDQKTATITGVSMVLGLSAGIFGGLDDGISSQLLSNTIVVGGMTAIGMTLLGEIARFRTTKLRVDLSRSCLPAVDEFLSSFADRHSWTEQAKDRLRLVGEEVVLSLLEDELEEPTDCELQHGGSAVSTRRLVATVRPEIGFAELELVVASDSAIQGNIEDRLVYLGEEQALEDERDLSVRILRHYASSVNHRKYYGLDIITCRVEK